MQEPLPGIEAHKRAIPRDRVAERLGFREVSNPKLGGVLILLYQDTGGEVFFPLIQRPEYPGAHGGQMSLPGGKAEEGDVSIEDTALRETHEEIGVSPEEVRVIGNLSELYIPPSNFRVTPVVGFAGNLPEFKRDPVEVEEIHHVPLRALMDRKFHKKRDIRVRGMQFPDTPYFELDRKVVWGATAMILTELYLILEMEFSGS